MSQCTSLASEATTGNGSDYVELTFNASYFQGSSNFSLNDFHTEVIIQILLVNGDNTGTGDQSYSGYGRLSSTSSAILHFCHFSFLPLLEIPDFRLLSFMLVFCTSINLQLLSHISAQRTLRQHALNSMTQDFFRLLFQ